MPFKAIRYGAAEMYSFRKLNLCLSRLSSMHVPAVSKNLSFIPLPFSCMVLLAAFSFRDLNPCLSWLMYGATEMCWSISSQGCGLAICNLLAGSPTLGC